MPSPADLQVVLSLVDNATPALERTSGAMSTMGGIAAGAAVAGFAALAGGMAATVGAATNFEHALSGIQAVSGATTADLDRIRQTALQLGKDTSFSAQEAATGMEELIKAGLPLEAVLQGGARAALDLAAATGTAVPEAAEIMSNAMNTFSNDGLTAAQVADTFTQAANASSTSVHELGYSFSAVGAVAKTVGIGFTDVATTLALFAQNGLKGSDAGTSLKTMLMRLVPSTNEANDEMRRLGIITGDTSPAMGTLTTVLQQTAAGQKALAAAGKDGVVTEKELFNAVKDLNPAALQGASNFTEYAVKTGVLGNQFFDASGNAKSMAEIAQVLQNALAGMSREQQLATLQTLFGSDAIRGAAILMEAGADGMNNMSTAMKASGDAQSSAATRLDNLKGSLEKFRGSIETGAIIVGSLFLPALKQIVDGATETANTVVDAFEQIPDVLGTIAAVWAGTWVPNPAVVRPFTEAVGEMAMTLTSILKPAVDAVLPTIQSLWASAFDFIVQNGATIQGALVGIGVAFAALLGASAVAGVIGAIAAALGLLLSPIGLVLAAGALLGAAWVNDWGGIQEKTAAVVAWFTENLPLMIQTAQTVAAGIAQAWATLGPSMLASTQQTWSVLDAEISARTTELGGLIKAGMQAINGDWRGAWQTLTQVAQVEQQRQTAEAQRNSQMMLAAIDSFTNGSGTAMAAWVDTNVAAFTTWAGATSTAVTTWSSTTLTAITTWAGTVGSALSTWASTAGTTIQTWADTAVATLSTWGSNAQSTTTTGIGLVQTAIATGIGLIQSAWQTGWTIVGSILTAAWAVLTPENQAAISAIQTQFSTFLGLLPQLWQAGLDVVTTTLTAWWTAATTAWNTAQEAISTTVQSWWTTIQGFWQAGLEAITNILTPWWTALQALWQTGTETVSTTTTTWMTTLQGLFETGLQLLLTTVQAITQPIVQAFTDTWQQVSTTVTTAAGELAAQATALAQGVGTAIVNTLSEWGDTVGQAAAQLGDSIIQGIVVILNNSVGLLTSAISSLLQQTIAAAQAAIGARSPSTVMADLIGRPMGEGIIKGFQDALGQGNPQIIEAIGAIGHAIMQAGLPTKAFIDYLALAKTESGLFSRAVGDAGQSVGLFQLHAEGMGRALGDLRFDPVINANTFINNTKGVWQEMRGGVEGTTRSISEFGNRAEGSAIQFSSRYGTALSEVNAALEANKGAFGQSSTAMTEAGNAAVTSAGHHNTLTTAERNLTAAGTTKTGMVRDQRAAVVAATPAVQGITTATRDMWWEEKNATPVVQGLTAATRDMWYTERDAKPAVQGLTSATKDMWYEHQAATPKIQGVTSATRDMWYTERDTKPAVDDLAEATGTLGDAANSAAPMIDTVRDSVSGTQQPLSDASTATQDWDNTLNDITPDISTFTEGVSAANDELSQLDHPVAVSFTGEAPSTVQVEGIDAQNLTAESSNLNDARVNDASIDNPDISDAEIKDADIPKADFSKSDFVRTDMTRTDIDANRIDASRVDSERVDDMTVRNMSGGTTRTQSIFDLAALGEIAPGGTVQRAGKIEHHYHLTINTASPVEPVLQDFAAMKALAGV